MNKIFKTKRSRKFDAVVAVSELSNNHRKTGGTTLLKATFLALSSVMMTGMAFPASVVFENNSVVSEGSNVKEELSVVILNPKLYDAKFQNEKRYKNVSILPTDDAYKNNNGIIVGSVLIGSGADFVATLSNSQVNNGGQGVALGANAVTTAQATSIGNDVYAFGRGSVAIGGDDAAVPDRKNPLKSPRYSVEGDGSLYEDVNQYLKKINKDGVGVNYNPTFARGVASVAIGPRALAYEESGISIGHLAASLGTKSMSFGYMSQADADNAVALGTNAWVKNKDSLALGSGSVADVDVKPSKYFGSRADEEAYEGPVVSFGDGALHRRLKHVAAGGEDTDAVNLAQLNSLAGNTFKLSADSEDKVFETSLGVKGGINIKVQGTENQITTSMEENTVKIGECPEFCVGVISSHHFLEEHAYGAPNQTQRSDLRSHRGNG